MRIGIRVSDLQEEEMNQITIFDKDIEKKILLDKTIDSIRDKYGKNKIVRANQLSNPYYHYGKKNDFLHNLNVKF